MYTGLYDRAWTNVFVYVSIVDEYVIDMAWTCNGWICMFALSQPIQVRLLLAHRLRLSQYIEPALDSTTVGLVSICYLIQQF